MNFQLIPPVPNSKELLDIAFRKAREKIKLKKPKGEGVQLIRRKESAKLDIIKDILLSRLEKILQTFPEEKKLSPFYVKLIKLTLDYPLFKQSFGAVDWARAKLRAFHKEYNRKISRAGGLNELRDSSKQFYGRVSSVLKQIDSNLRYLERSRKIMKTYPDVKEMPTVCIYGFPNVGKSTLLNKLCGVKAKVASYAFTTLTINAGYLTAGNKIIQILDVPGTLARREKMNNFELMAELVLEELADPVIYVFDLSGYSGYPVEEQEELFQKVRKRKKVLVYLAKTDLTEPPVLSQFPHRHYSLEELGRELEKELGKELGEELSV